MPFLLFQGIGVPELLIIFAIVVVLFGASRIADIGGALGRSIRAFRRELKGTEEEEKAGEEEKTTSKTEPPSGGPLQH